MRPWTALLFCALLAGQAAWKAEHAASLIVSAAQLLSEAPPEANDVSQCQESPVSALLTKSPTEQAAFESILPFDRPCFDAIAATAQSFSALLHAEQTLQSLATRHQI